MVGLANVLNTVHLLLTAGFVAVTFALLTVSIVNRLRIRNVVLSWRPISVSTLPFGPLGFIILVLLLEVISWYGGHELPRQLFFGYLTGSFAWLAAAILANTVVVSECGIIGDINRRDLAVSWSKICDYFEFDRARGGGFVFLFHDGTPVQRRLELTVPARHREALRHLVQRRLRDRFEPADRWHEGKTALEG